MLYCSASYIEELNSEISVDPVPDCGPRARGAARRQIKLGGWARWQLERQWAATGKKTGGANDRITLAGAREEIPTSDC
jgi:hypothetical protein